jgi:hypothetical protein
MFLGLPEIVRETLIPTVLWLLYDFLSLKNLAGFGSVSLKFGSPDPYQDVTDP